MYFQLSWGASSPLLSDNEKFPRFFRVVAPETKANVAKVELARYFGWKRIATLNVALDYYSSVRCQYYFKGIIA